MSSKRPAIHYCAIRYADSGENQDLIVSGNAIVGFNKTWVLNPRAVPPNDQYIDPQNRGDIIECQILFVGSHIACNEYFDELHAQEKAQRKAARKAAKQAKANSTADWANRRVHLSANNDENSLIVTDSDTGTVRSRYSIPTPSSSMASASRLNSSVDSAFGSSSGSGPKQDALAKVTEQLKILQGEFQSLKNALVEKSTVSLLSFSMLSLIYLLFPFVIQSGQVKFTPNSKIPYTNQQVLSSCAQGASPESLLNMLQTSLKERMDCVRIGYDTWQDIPKGLQDSITELISKFLCIFNIYVLLSNLFTLSLFHCSCGGPWRAHSTRRESTTYQNRSGSSDETL